MKITLNHLWQFPQHLVAWIIIALFSTTRLPNYNGRKVYRYGSKYGSVCLGNYLFMTDKSKNEIAHIAHEYGHSVQSLRWGWLYFLIIGLPSVLGVASGSNYYRRWPENQANRLGGVEIVITGKRPCDYYLKLKQ